MFEPWNPKAVPTLFLRRSDGIPLESINLSFRIGGNAWQKRSL
ncbi:hypothetical protein [Acinetobacter sp. YH16053]|nr:hypothetical protein [Acinetobacter sp. YH16053]